MRCSPPTSRSSSPITAIPWLIHRLTYRRTNHAQLHVRGFKERGTTTTPFDMVMLNDLDRFHLVIDVIDRVDGLASRAAVLRQRMLDARLAARRYTREHGEDDPAISDWTWDAGYHQATSLSQGTLSEDRASPGRLGCSVRPSRGSRASAPAGRAAVRTAPLPHLRRHRRGRGGARADQSHRALHDAVGQHRDSARRRGRPAASGALARSGLGASSVWAASIGSRVPATRWPRLRWWCR